MVLQNRHISVWEGWVPQALDSGKMAAASMTTVTRQLLITTMVLTALAISCASSQPSSADSRPVSMAHVRAPRYVGPPLAHNLTLGKPGKYDKLLYLTRVQRGSQRGGVSATVSYPPSWPPFEFITAIVAEDVWRNGSNGYPYLAAGGLYQRTAAVRIESGPRYGLDFVVKFFGH